MGGTQPERYDLVLRGGRVIDPESGLDGVREVGITGRSISAVSEDRLSGGTILDVTGMVVCPGFIDLHSHGQGIAEQRLQALDGVTTSLELEAGAHPAGAVYARAAAEGRPIHFGYSASWALCRMHVLAGLEFPDELGGVLAHIGDPAWQGHATHSEVGVILDLLESDLVDGALGIGILVGYAPQSDPGEYLAVSALAAAGGVPTYTHARDLAEYNPAAPVDGATEVVRAAAETGARMHYCHINSTSARHIDRVLDLVGRVQSEGSAVTTEAYPYGTGMTGIGAAFLSAEHLAERGLSPSSIRYAPTGEWVRDADHLARLRAEDPGGLAFIRMLDEDDPDDFAYVTRALVYPDTAVASDAIPLLYPGGPPPPAETWPLPPGAVTHPRSAGTFSRFLRLVREHGLMSLTEAVGRCTLVPARVLQAAAPAMAAKGRLGPGGDADVVVFDPEQITDQATYTDTTRPSTGVRHVLVDGTFVVRDGEIVPDALPGRPVRSGRGTSPSPGG